MTTASSEIIKLTLQPTILGPVYPTNIFDIFWWCKDYEERNKFPATILNRFAIGFYQISQGIAWKDGGRNKYESYAAAALHFCMVAVRLELPVDDNMEIKLKDFPVKFIEHSAVELLYNLSAAQQQLFYASPSNKTQRASRYNKDKLARCLGEAIIILIGLIPVEYRSDCFELSSTIMTKGLK